MSIPRPFQQVIETAEAKKKEGDLLFTRSEFQDAIKTYHEVLQLLAPLRATPFGETIALRCMSNQIQCLLKLEKNEEVIGMCRFALTIPCAAHETHLAQKIHTRCSKAFENLGKFEHALAAIDRAISYDPYSRDLDPIRERVIASIKSDTSRIVAIPPRPANLEEDDVSKLIVEILKSRGDPTVCLPILNSLVSRSVFIDRRDSKKYNIMWAICRAAIHRSSIPTENADDVYPLLELIVMNGARPEQRYEAGIEKEGVSDKQSMQTPLMLFALAGAVDCARLLLKLGAGVMTCDSDGWTPLMISCAPNSPRRTVDSQNKPSNNDEMVELLLEHKSLVNVMNINGITPLCCATQAGDANSCALLIHAGARLNSRSSNGFSPIIWALIGAEGDDKSDIVQMILHACLMHSAKDAKAEGEAAADDEGAIKDAEEKKPPTEEQLALLAECMEDLKAFKVSHVILKLKTVVHELLVNYKKAQEALGNQDPSPPPSSLVQRRLAEALCRPLVIKAGGAKDITGKYLMSIPAKDLYSSTLLLLVDEVFPQALFKQWTPVDDPTQAVRGSSPLDQARLAILMTAVTGPKANEPPLSRNTADDFMMCGRYPDYRMLIREPLVSLFSSCVPNQAAVDSILASGPIALLFSTGADYWLRVLKESAGDSGLDVILFRSDDPHYNPPYFDTTEAIGTVTDLSGMSDRTLVMLWPISNMLSYTPKETVEKEEALLLTYTGPKVFILGDVDTNPVGKEPTGKEFLQSNFECTDTIPLQNWPEKSNSVTTWLKLSK